MVAYIIFSTSMFASIIAYYGISNIVVRVHSSTPPDPLSSKLSFMVILKVKYVHIKFSQLLS